MTCHVLWAPTVLFEFAEVIVRGAWSILLLVRLVKAPLSPPRLLLVLLRLQLLTTFIDCGLSTAQL